MANRHRQLNYGSPLPQDFLDAIQDFIGSLLVNFRLLIVTNGTALQVPGGPGNDYVGAGIQGRWRFNQTNIQGAHPGGAAGTYDVYVTASDNSFTAGGPSGEIDNTNYEFALQITPTASSPTTALKRRIAQAVWDGSRITRVIGLSGNLSADATQFVVLAPDSSGRNTVQPTADFINLTLKRLAGQTSDLQRWVDENGVPLAQLTASGMFISQGGLVLPGMTTTARDALPAGRRPHGLQIFNDTTGTVEVNVGTDAAPVWIPAGGYGAGIILDFAGPEANIPPRTVPCDGRQIAQTAEPAAYQRIGNGWNTFGGLPAPPAGFFRAPDLRGRGTIGKGDMGAGSGTTPAATGPRVQRAAVTTLGALIGEEYHTLGMAELTPHSHSGATGTESALHTHGVNDPTHTHPGGYYKDYAPGGTGGPGPGPGNDAMTAITAAATGITLSTESASHTHAIPSEGGGSGHENVHPVAVVNKVMTL